jgi:hypothetical protein
MPIMSLVSEIKQLIRSVNPTDCSLLHALNGRST